ncbi:MAG: hypothetical protein AcusKO_37870 [Acuticoccus sp.]
MGTAAANAIRRVRPDLFVMGVTGLPPDTGATTGDAEEAEIKALIAAQSAETMVLASAEKLGAASPCLSSRWTRSIGWWWRRVHLPRRAPPSRRRGRPYFAREAAGASVRPFDDAPGRAVEVVVLAVFHRPQEGDEAERTEPQRDGNQKQEHRHQGLPEAVEGATGRARRSALSVTTIEDDDMASAATSGEA